ncbi:MAG TPA: ion channel, partial [Spirochaetia bacterium]|nr:ion channel [Spirochaetia bacterium]
YRNSRIVKLMIFFLLIFLVSGTLVAILEHGRNSEFKNVPDGWWWAVVTFSTTGYGDMVPKTIAGRLIAVVTIFVGIAAMSVLSGTFASLFVDQNTRARRGLVELTRLQDHIIICGWKEDMQEILLEILRDVRGLTADMLVLVSNVESERIEELRGNDQLRELRFVRGDYFSDNTLRRANVRTARKVLVLADEHETTGVSELDSRTVMTVLAIKSMARDVYVVAELLDRKYENYLRQAMCEEIIFINDLNRSIIANSSATNGMSHIVHDLLAYSEEAARLSTIEIDPQFFGSPYVALRSHVAEAHNIVLLGILENTGSPQSMKLEALREAQKTSDVSMLVTNLQSVKGMAVNRPVFIPADDYVIQRHSRAIVLERDHGK